MQHFYKVPEQHIVVVHDELDIPFGEIRTKVSGGSAGHNGIKSVIEHIGEGFGRVRIGINNELSAKYDSADFVLAKFTNEEQEQLETLKKEVVSLLTEYIVGQSLEVTTRNFLS